MTDQRDENKSFMDLRLCIITLLLNNDEFHATTSLHFEINCYVETIKSSK